MQRYIFLSRIASFHKFFYERVRSSIFGFLINKVIRERSLIASFTSLNVGDVICVEDLPD